MQILSGSKKWFALAGAGVLAFGVAACTQVVPSFTAHPANVDGSTSAIQVVPTAAVPVVANPTRTTANAPKTAAVTRGSITETMSLDGTVTADGQQPVSYNGRGNVVDVKVNVGDTVKQGDQLLELEGPHHLLAQDVAQQLQQAAAKLDADKSSLAKAQAAAAAQQQQAARAALTAAQQQQQAVADATNALKRAQDNLARVQAGPLPTDRQAAQSAVNSAQNALQRAQDTYDAVASGPNQDAIKAATRDVTNAQSALAKAQADFATLTRGPDPSAVRQAQAALDKAQTQLQIAQVSKPDPKLDPSIARLQHDQSVSDAQLGVDNASAALVKLKQPPADVDVQAARQKVSDAQDALDTANAHLAQVQSGPDPQALATAQAAIDKARQDYLAAQSKLNDLNSHPTPTELSDAQDQVRKAQTALDQAQTSTGAAADANGNDQLTTLQNQIDADQVTINGLQQTLDATKLLAPSDGVIAAVRVKAGQAITSEKPVFMLAPIAPPVVHADLDDNQVQKLSVGETASVSLDPGNPAAATVPATISAITPASADGATAAYADLQVQWPSGTTPKFGAPVEVDLTLQQKDGVLIVPTSALHQAGSKTTVQVQNGTLKRLAEVQIGIKNATTAEIVSGLSEGQTVIIGTP